MDTWKLTDEELDGIVDALEKVGRRSKHGQRLLDEAKTAQLARHRRREEDAEWDSSR